MYLASQLHHDGDIERALYIFNNQCNVVSTDTRHDLFLCCLLRLAGLSLFANYVYPTGLVQLLGMFLLIRMHTCQVQPIILIEVVLLVHSDGP